ncbi:MAG: hypothetical protein HQK50_17010 [Oligoflexia bacterium]|nr:hypothetical protein [Oligoflexia bacterium]MBF0367280.1 hypothetical protein [Oligoflexia bacterium]
MNDLRKNSAKVVLQESLQHPLTLFPTAAGILGGVGSALFGVTALSASLAIAGITIGLGSLLLNYFYRGDYFISRHLKALQVQADRQMQLLSERLKQSLNQRELTTEASQFAKQALTQLELLQKKYQGLKTLLERKLNPQELTFGRFLMSADQVHHAILDNLDMIADKLAGLASIDQRYSETRIREIKQQRSMDAADEEELKTLQAREELRVAHMEKINVLLTYNEQALTALDKSSAAITEMKGKSGRSPVDLTFATQELESIANRVRNL